MINVKRGISSKHSNFDIFMQIYAEYVHYTEGASMKHLLTILNHLDTVQASRLENAITCFRSDLSEIFGPQLKDVILYGSVADGSYIPHKGDIDFIVLVDQLSVDAYFDSITDLHRTYRRSGEFIRYFEGCYVCIDTHTLTERGIYIGTNETGWKVFNEAILTQIDYASIYENGISLMANDAYKSYFVYDQPQLNQELVAMSKHHLEISRRFSDWDFRLHLLHTGARAYSKLKDNEFRSKSAALNWLGQQKGFQSYENLILSLSHYRSKLSLDEKSALDCIGSEITIDLIESLYQHILKEYD